MVHEVPLDEAIRLMSPQSFPFLKPEPVPLDGEEWQQALPRSEWPDVHRRNSETVLEPTNGGRFRRHGNAARLIFIIKKQRKRWSKGRRIEPCRLSGRNTPELRHGRRRIMTQARLPATLIAR